MPDNGDGLALLLRAIKFSAEKHKGQKRKDDKTPYINHPIEVMELLTAVGLVTDVEVLSAAVLHDTIEDTSTSVEELRSVFGEVITGYVLECTDDKELPKAERKRLQEVHAPHLSVGAKLIKICDKTSNMRDMVDSPPPDWTWARRSEYLNWCSRVFIGLKGVNTALDNLFEERLKQSRQLLDRENSTSRV